MARSIRISETLYEAADAMAGKLCRSLAQQIEYWAELGRAIEAAGVTTTQALQILESDVRARERLLMKMGIVDQESMLFIPTAVAQRTRVKFPELSAVEED